MNTLINLSNIEIKQEIKKLIENFNIEIDDDINKKIQQSSKTRRETLIKIYENLIPFTNINIVSEPIITEPIITEHITEPIIDIKPTDEVIIINPDNNNENMIEKNLLLKELRYKITLYKSDIKELRIENQNQLQLLNDYKYKIKNYKYEIKNLYKKLKKSEITFSSDSDSNNKNNEINTVYKISYSEVKKLRDNKINKKLIEKGFKYEDFCKLSYHEKKQLFNKNNNNKFIRIFNLE